MPARTEIRRDLHNPDELKRMARNEKMPRKAKRLLAIAHAMDGMTFTAAAKAVGMERQALSDAIKRYNAESTDGLRVFPYQIESQGFSNQSEYDSSSMLEVEASMDGKTLFS